ncbi:DmsC/YnfH family molybdoenzyme membrane anchor subunit [Berryella wangjianweii]|uniref:DmsC/YnfH family molybdoenzyme membrane anchor subunit n=1 Tax=Berryella wangjianweii TaxID=2734634 RepID=UPI0021BD4791|nr:DmsC/YnfH family molybdoenzyme membrane anchor subunit [Berryella wangjianweii]
MIPEFTLFIFTTLAGIAAGAYLMGVAFPISDTHERRPWLFPLAMLMLLGMGLIGCLGHLHRPERFLNALWNPMAGITQEAYLSILFGAVLAADLILRAAKGSSPWGLRLAGAIFGFLLTCVMGFAYANTLGVAAWATPATIPLFVVGDMAMGAVLWAAVKSGAHQSKGYRAATGAIEALLALTLVAVAIHFSSLGLSAAPFIAAIVLAPVAHTAALYAARLRPAVWKDMLACVCVIAGVSVARYAFYAAYLG